MCNQQFDSKDSAITAVQNKKDWKFEGLDSLQCSTYSSIQTSSIHVKSKLKTGYIWLKSKSGEFDVNISLNNSSSVTEVSKKISQTYFADQNDAKTNVENSFKELPGVKTVVVEENETTRSQLSFNVYLTYEDSVSGPAMQTVLINVKDNLNKRYMLLIRL